MVDKNAIFKIFNEYFREESGLLKIQEDGTVDHSGAIRMIKPASHFPVKFGKIGDYFSCLDMKLTSLIGGPTEVGHAFNARQNKLTSLEGAPVNVGYDFDVRDNPLKSLKGAPKWIDRGFKLDYNDDLPLLRTLGAGKVEFGYTLMWQYQDDIEDVLNQFAGKGQAAAMDCAKALMTLEKKLGINIRANIKW